MKSHHCNQPNTSTRIQSLRVSISQCREKNVAWILDYELSYIRIIVALTFGISRFKFHAIMNLWKITFRKDKQIGSSCLTPADKLGNYFLHLLPFQCRAQENSEGLGVQVWIYVVLTRSMVKHLHHAHALLQQSSTQSFNTHTIRFTYTRGTGTDLSKNLNVSLSLSFHQCSILSVPITVWTLIPSHPQKYPHKFMLHVVATASVLIKHKTWWITLADPAAIYKLYHYEKWINDVCPRWNLQNGEEPSSNSYTRNVSTDMITAES